MDTNNKFEQDLIGSSAYKNPEGKRVIDEAIARTHAAEAAGNTGEVEKITLELAETLNRIAATPEGTLATPEFFTDMEKQFSERVDELDAFGIIDKADPKITGIDKKLYPAPSWEQIRTGFTPEKIELIKQLENPILLLVPDGMSLDEYITKAIQPGPKKKELHWSKSSDLKNFNADKDGELISDAVRYDKTNHGGKTKAERLQEPGALGWQVLVVDGGDEVPESTLKKSADTLLTEFREQGFGGLSAEAYISLQMHEEVLAQRKIDKQSVGFLLESYLLYFDRGSVMHAYAKNYRTYFAGYEPERSHKDIGARRAVRIL